MALAAAAAAPVARMVRRLESIIGYLPCRCMQSAQLAPGTKYLDRRNSSRDFERYLIVLQIKLSGAAIVDGVGYPASPQSVRKQKGR
jgi:hypothetical protein